MALPTTERLMCGTVGTTLPSRNRRHEQNLLFPVARGVASRSPFDLALCGDGRALYCCETTGKKKETAQFVQARVIIRCLHRCTAVSAWCGVVWTLGGDTTGAHGPDPRVCKRVSLPLQMSRPY